jgi:hypothetical protein
MGFDCLNNLYQRPLTILILYPFGKDLYMTHLSQIYITHLGYMYLA